jgi:hypothetical protein
LVAAVLLGATGLAVSAPPPGSAASGPTLLRVSGTLLTAPAEDGGDASYAVALGNGDIVPVTGDLADAPARASFTGTLRLPAAVRSGGATLLAESAAGRDALALVESRSMTLPVAWIERITALPAAVAPTTHQVYVAAPLNAGDFAITEGEMLARVAQATTFWEDEANGAIADVVVPASVRRYTSAQIDLYDHCGLDGWTYAAVVQEAAALFPAADFDEGTDQLVVLMPPACSGGGTLGRAVLGDSFASGGYQVSLAEGNSVGTLAHEMGHNYGFMHANIGRCEPFSGGCFGEYRNLYNVMGRGTFLPYNRLTAISTVYRSLNGVTDVGEVEDVQLPAGSAPTTVTRTLLPRAADAGLRALQVTDADTGDPIFVEYRSGTGKDAGSAYAASYTEGGTVYRPGVVLEEKDGRQANLLGGPDGVAMVEGNEWTNGSGTLSVSVAQVTPTGATVTVTQTPGPPVTPPASVAIAGDPHPPYGALQLEMGDWDPAPSAYDIQWYADGVALPGWTSYSFYPSVDDVGSRITVSVTAWAYGSRPTTVTSDAVEIPPAVIPVTASPTLSGTPSVGSTLTSVGGRWDPIYGVVEAHWQWQADQVTIAGAPDSRFLTLTEAQAGARVRACQVLSAPGYESTTICSNETAPVTSLPAIQVVGTPTVSGTPGVDMPLTGSRGTWTSGVGFTYAWLVDGLPVPGATGTTFAPRGQDAGKAVTFQVTGSKPGYATATRTSVPTGPVRAPIPVAPLPTVAGTPKVGLPLTCTPGDWSAGTTFSYEWIIGGIPLGDGGGSTYTPPGSYAGETIGCRVTGSLAGYADTRRRSADTAPVARGTLTAATPTIGGTVKVGRTLTARPGTWTSGTRFAYRWYANGAAIPRATTSRLSLPRSLKGRRITVKVTGTKTGYTTLSRTSAKTSRVAG